MAVYGTQHIVHNAQELVRIRKSIFLFFDDALVEYYSRPLYVRSVREHPFQLELVLMQIPQL